VHAPPNRAGDLAEAVADLETRRAKPRTLKRELSLPKPYELLTDADVKAFQAERMWPKPQVREGDPRFKGITDVFTFSDVYFSNNGRIALTAMSSWCGGLCAKHQWRVLEKTPTGEWREQPSWVSCVTVATRNSAAIRFQRIEIPNMMLDPKVNVVGIGSPSLYGTPRMVGGVPSVTSRTPALSGVAAMASNSFNKELGTVIRPALAPAVHRTAILPVVALNRSTATVRVPLIPIVTV
jgi:hypothetical protein